MSIERICGGVTAAKGFEAAGAAAGVKYKDRKDMALVYSQAPCRLAGVFTSNVVKAAPVLWDRNAVEHSAYGQAVVVNSGIANACTGTAGYECCKRTAEHAAKELGIPMEAVLVASTGVIGMQIPVEKIIAGIEELAKVKSGDIEAGTAAAEAIMTTDTVSKEAAVQFEIDGKTVTVGGMCKGSGMIHPNMGTMLGFVTTDIAISKELLQEALRADVQDTFNMISVDGDTSTNDTLLVLANVICSNLTKAAIFGHDANWGRILCALGYSGVTFDPERIELFFEGENGRIQIYKDGAAADYSEEEATKILSEPEVRVVVDMKMGDFEACAWGCDLTFDYVKINADYRS